MPEKVSVDKKVIERAVYTLKTMDVRGYDSINKLVGLVILFESMLEKDGGENG